jgi:hypothetical protein
VAPLPTGDMYEKLDVVVLHKEKIVLDRSLNKQERFRPVSGILQEWDA